MKNTNLETSIINLSKELIEYADNVDEIERIEFSHEINQIGLASDLLKKSISLVEKSQQEGYTSKDFNYMYCMYMIEAYADVILKLHQLGNDHVSRNANEFAKKFLNILQEEKMK